MKESNTIGTKDRGQNRKWQSRKRKTTASARAAEEARPRRILGELGTLFVGLLLIVLAFVEGDSVWKSAHQILFGLFGCGSFVLGAAV